MKLLPLHPTHGREVINDKGWVDWVLSRIFPQTNVYKRGSPYLRRYFVYDGRFGRVLIHRLMQPDADRHLHDHPWDAVFIVFGPGYLETTMKDGQQKAHWRGLRWLPSIRFHPAERPHKIEALGGDSVWTIALATRHKRSWGFHTEDGWVPWTEYEG